MNCPGSRSLIETTNVTALLDSQCTTLSEIWGGVRHFSIMWQWSTKEGISDIYSLT